MKRPFFAATCSALLLAASVAVAAPPNDECASAIALGSPPFSTFDDLTSATDNGADPVRSCSGEIGHHNVWFTFTAAGSGRLSVVSTVQLTLYTGTCGALVEAACGAQSLSVLITAGETYTLEVSGPEVYYSLDATVCGDGIVSAPFETCDDGNLVNGDACDDGCRLECPEDLCRCLPNASKFAVVGGTLDGRSGKFNRSDYPQSTFIGGSICGRTGKLSGKLDAETYIASSDFDPGDVILTSAVGTTAVRFKGPKLDRLPNPGVFVDGDVATGGGVVQNPQYAEVTGVTDTSGTHTRVAICQQALSELTTASATLASLAPTQTLGTLVVAPGNSATITVGPGRQVVNIESIKLKSTTDEFGDITGSELDFVLDPATSVLVVNVAKSFAVGAGAVVREPGGDADVIFNLLPGAKLKLEKGTNFFGAVLAPTAKIRIPPYYDDDAFDAFYTTQAVRGKGANVYGYFQCP
jgi:choice-of-anchor A domain-containing protein